MIVCLCHRISDRDIATAVQSGTRCFEVLQDETRIASSCGCCHECAQEVFEKALARTGAPVVVQVARLTREAAGVA
jgi:bacterioferritin-associated ferredoxin